MNFDRHERIEGRRLRDEMIWLGDEWAQSIVQCELQNCHLVLDSAGSYARIFRSKLHRCTVEAKRKMKNTSFFGCDFIDCSFKGKYYGVDFGRSPWPDDVTKQFDQYGELIDCDFTQATLDLCRFFSVDINRQTFAPWPQFVVPAERRLTAFHMNRSWPGKLGSYFALAKNQDQALTGLSGTAADFIRHYAVSEEELMQALNDIGGVIR
jgi:hypothetical protein